MSAITKNKIDGLALMELNEDHLSEIAPLIGDRIKLKRAIREAMLLSSSSLASYPHSIYIHVAILSNFASNFALYSLIARRPILQ